MRVAIAGFQHETNTFVTTPTGLPELEQADSWPALLTGEAVIAGTRGMNLPIAGFAQAALKSPSVELLPILWCAAEPGGRVTDHAFETIRDRILHTLGAMDSVDAVYLDLHGAMVTESHEDGEGQLLCSIRNLIGSDLPLVISLDLHANVTQKMVKATDAITIYRTYPHLDMAETGGRAFSMLEEIMQAGPPAKAWRQGNYLIPLHAQYTGAEPARTLYAGLKEFCTKVGQTAELALGFTAADIYDAGPSVLAYAATQIEAEHIADRMLARLNDAEQHFDCTLLSAEDAVARALQASRERPVIIADVQDNPGAGASSDTTGLLRALIRLNAPDAMLGMIHDPQLASDAHSHGVGACFMAAIGGRGPGDAPVKAMVYVEQLSDGDCLYTGEMYGGGSATLGPSAALKLEGTDIQIVVTSIRNQCLDLAHFHHFGLQPEKAQIVCVKSTAHFRADFDPIAEKTLLAGVPGQFPCMLQDVKYANLRDGLFRSPRHAPD